MSPPGAFAPFAAPLIGGYAAPRCCACAVVPARNEEAALHGALDALRLQRDCADKPLAHDRYEVILLLNNCTDASLQVAERYRGEHPGFQLHVATALLEPAQAHVGTARRLLMDTAHTRLSRCANSQGAAILSTDADTVVAPDWIAQNLAAIAAGADAVGGVIDLLPAELDGLRCEQPAVYTAYCLDRQLQRAVAQLEAALDPDPADPWPRHMEHFGASLACTPAIYARVGGLPPVKPLEDVAFVGALRSIGARIRHAPEVRVFTSARMDGRAEVGLSGQLRHWQRETQAGEPHMVDSAAWMQHRFGTIAALRRFNEAEEPLCANSYPAHWRKQMLQLHRRRMPTAEFLAELDCELLVDEMFTRQRKPRRARITEVLKDLAAMLGSLAEAETAKV